MPAPARALELSPNLRSAPLTLGERKIILDAVTTGNRKQRAVADDPTIHGTRAQVRAVVNDALRDDPTLIERFPSLRCRKIPEVQVLDVVETDGSTMEQTAAESLVAAGVTPADVRPSKIVTWVRTRVHLMRNSDGTFAAVRVQHVEARVEWALIATAPTTGAAVPALQDQQSHADHTTSRGGVQRLRLAAALGLLVVLLELGATLVRLGAAPVTPTVASGFAEDRLVPPPQP